MFALLAQRVLLDFLALTRDAGDSDNNDKNIQEGFEFISEGQPDHPCKLPEL